MRTPPLLVALAVPAILTASPPAAAQNSIPAELATALVAMPTGSTPEQIVVGRIPNGFPAGVAPAGGRVLGGIARDTSSAVAAFAVPQAPAEATAALRQALAEGGWSSPGDPRPQRGFIDPNPMRNMGFLCRGAEMLSTAAAPAPGGGAYVRLDYSRARRMSPCAMMRAARPGGMAPWDSVPIPALTAPEGATALATGSGVLPASFGRSGASASTRLRTDQSAAALVQHYAAQLRAAGWTPAPAAASPTVVAQAFRMRGEDGKEWFGVLTATAFPDSPVRDLSFQVNPLPPTDPSF
ncbi:MAG TPA: hypothetical protein VF092_10035 [Longimicrobium sp.]